MSDTRQRHFWTGAGAALGLIGLVAISAPAAAGGAAGGVGTLQAPAGGRGARGAGAAAPARGGGGPQEPRSNVGPADRPRVDPVAADRGAHVWAVECVTCHGSQGRGTDKGPNLLRSDVILHDRFGSELKPFLQKGHPTQSGTPSASLTPEQVTDLTHFLRQRILDTLRGSVKFTEGNILVGDPKAGAAYFAGAGQCTTCHSASGDLAGVAGRISDPVALQQRMLFPAPGRGGGRGRGAPAGGAAANRTAVTVTLAAPSTPPVSGILVQMDDFYVTYRDDEGVPHVVKRTPGMTVTITDPLQAHHDLLDRISDANIHDLVAYLETLQ